MTILLLLWSQIVLWQLPHFTSALQYTWNHFLCSCDHCSLLEVSEMKTKCFHCGNLLKMYCLFFSIGNFQKAENIQWILSTESLLVTMFYSIYKQTNNWSGDSGHRRKQNWCKFISEQQPLKITMTIKNRMGSFFFVLFRTL